jgi:hypothetical protein
MTETYHRRITSVLPAALAAMLLAVAGTSYAADSHSTYTANRPSPESVCEKKKVLAAGTYYQCLAHALAVKRDGTLVLPEIAISRCDKAFDEAFARAEARERCRTAGGPSTLRGPIRAQAQDTAEVVTSGPGCPSGNLTVKSQETATCRVSTSASAIDLAAIVTQLSAQGVSMDSVLWIQAWGARGGAGSEKNGGGGGPAGYAQTITTVGDFLSDFGVTEIYYYLGDNGTTLTSSGGSGGAATLVTVNDLTESAAAFAETVLVAGGGGGGGAGRGPKTLVCGTYDDVLGGGGGAGGIAIASNSQTGAVVLAAGSQGGERRNVQRSGHGGGGALSGPGGSAGGGNAVSGDSGIAGLGGAGGSPSSNQNNPKVAFINQSATKITASGGRGGQPGDTAGGGGGGGGHGGGGGGTEGTNSSTCVSGGGGGGGSMANQAKADCPAAPTSAPSNPNGNDEGFVQIVFDLGACSSN